MYHHLPKKQVKSENSSKADHLLFCYHPVPYDDFSILKRGNKFFLLELKDGLLIIRDQPSLNMNIASAPSLYEKCPNTDFFLFRSFLYSELIRRFTPQISVFIPNSGKYRPEITPYLDTFHAVHCTHATGSINKVFFTILFAFSSCYVEWTFYYFVIINCMSTTHSSWSGDWTLPLSWVVICLL